MIPVLIVSHLIQQRASLASLQFGLDFGSDLVQRGILILTHHVHLAVSVRSAVLLMFVADLQRQAAAERTRPSNLTSVLHTACFQSPMGTPMQT